MTDTFNFLNRMDEYLASGPAVMTTARELCLTDRRVTRAADASRISETDVRAHVVEVVLDVAKERVHEPLSQALFDHFAAVKAEFEIVEGEMPEASHGADACDEWCAGLKAQIVNSLLGSDVDVALGGAQNVNDAFGCVSEVLGADCSADKLADAVLAVPVADPEAALSRMGATPAAIDALVAELRQPALHREANPEFVPAMDEALDMDQRKLEALMGSAEWGLDTLQSHCIYFATAKGVDVEVLREGVGYVLCESDPDLRRTGAELLGLAGDASFETWLDERAAFSTPEQDRLDADEVMRLATQEGGDAPEVRSHDTSSTAVVAAGGDAGDPPAAQTAPRPRAAPPVAAEESDLTRAVGAALAVLYDHGCETDKAMAEALGVQKAVVNQARHGKTPWLPAEDQILMIKTTLNNHRAPLALALSALDDLTPELS